MITNNDEWKDNIIAFLKRYMRSANHDFILGYCSHILSDMYNNINVWTPFRLKYSDELQKGFGNLHHQENNKIDIELALTYEGKNEFWANLAKSNSIDLPNIIYAEEIDKQKDNILNSWFKNKECQDISLNKIRTYESEMDFIKNATDFVVHIFQEHLNYIYHVKSLPNPKLSIEYYS